MHKEIIKIMKRALKIITLIITVLFCLSSITLAGCSNDGLPYSEYKLSKLITMTDYKNLTISAEDLQYELLQIFHDACADDATQKTYSEPVNGITVEKGDVVNMDYTGYIDGVAFQGGSASGSSLTIGSGSFIEGFEDGLIGASVNETRNVKATFPKNYFQNEDLSGKEATFTVKVNSIQRTYYPDYNDENVLKYTSYSSVEELESKECDGILKNLIWQKLYSLCEVNEYPSDKVNAWYDSYIRTYENYAENQNLSLETYVKYLGYTNLDSFKGYMASVAKNQVKQEMMLYSIVKGAKLKMTDDEYSSKAHEYWEKLCEGGYTGTYDEFVESYTVETIQKTLYYEKVLEYLVSVCKVV